MTDHGQQCHSRPEAPPTAQGLYDPQHEKAACGVGFVVHLKGQQSHSIVAQGLQLLRNLEHRGACGCEVNTGDGAGILVQMPDRFLRKVTAPLGITLPAAGAYGAGLVFLPHDAAQRAAIVARFEDIIREEGQTVLGWRDVPTDHTHRRRQRQRVAPAFAHLFIGRGASLAGRPRADPIAFERALYVIRKRVEHEIDKLELSERSLFYIVSLSSRTMIWKGMLTAGQLGDDVPRPERSGPRVGPGAGPPALQHQHVPVLAARAPVPRGRAQRRNQHAARQHQLDEGPRRPAPVRPVRRRSARASCRSSATAAATPRRSTTCSSSS